MAASQWATGRAAKTSREQAVEIGAVRHPLRAGAEAGIVREAGPLDRGAEAAPELLAADADDEPAVRGPESLVGREVRMGRAEPGGLPAVGEPGLRGVGEEGGAGVHHRDLDAAPAARGVPPRRAASTAERP